MVRSDDDNDRLLLSLTRHSAVEDQYRRLAGSLQDLKTRLDTAVSNQTQVRLSLNTIQNTVSVLDSRLQVVLLLDVFQYFPFCISLSVSCPISFQMSCCQAKFPEL